MSELTITWRELNTTFNTAVYEACEGVHEMDVAYNLAFNMIYPLFTLLKGRDAGYVVDVSDTREVAVPAHSPAEYALFMAALRLRITETEVEDSKIGRRELLTVIEMAKGDHLERDEIVAMLPVLCCNNEPMMEHLRSRL